MTEPLFTIPLWADLLGVGLGGIQGAMFASGFQGQRRLDWLGVAIIGVMIGMGGGLIRDLLIGQPPATLQNDWYLITAAGAALLGMLLAGVFNRINTFIVVLDAAVIGMFGAFGVSKAIAFGIPPVPAVFIGVCAAVGGGVLRDVLMGLPVAIMHVGSLYAVAAGVGCTAIVILHAFDVSITLAAVIGIVVTAVIRVLAVVFDVSLPEQRRLYRRKVATETGMIPIIKP
ncbi:trimeric intracellular cation channel family protein [Microbacterium sp. NPDC089987]|uniref:trimeric intracellular cation channel family protein n=1 Tax=Microbacterium sp. NPDC089987 TaxID=3364202 RepID=UPI003828E09B